MHTVVLPVYNERGNVESLVHALAGCLTARGVPFEIILVDDASSDGSLEVAQQLAAKVAGVRVLRHQRNLGQSAALATGFSAAHGQIIITLDSDGQNDPADLPALLDALTDSVDAVCGVRQKRQDTTIRRISSRLANRFRSLITGDTFQDSGCNFRVIRREAARELPVFNGLHRFIPFILGTQGFRVVQIPIGHRARTWGASKYGINNRLWRGLADCFAMRWWRKRALPGRRVRHE